MNILLGLTGSVASTLAEKLVTSLKEIGDVRVVMTNSAKHFVRIPVLASMCDHVLDDDVEWWYWRSNKEVMHIDLRRWADVLVLAPLSANTLAKAANGICDNLVTSVLRAWDTNRPVVIAPAMNTFMWEHPLTARHLEDFSKIYRTKMIPPVVKTLVCKDTGVGAMGRIEDIVDAVLKATQWLHPLITANGIPCGNHPGAFGFQRKHDIHTGVDLYTDDGQSVHAVEDGTVILIEKFTGASLGTPWWNETYAVMVEGMSGVVCYGEIKPSDEIGPGSKVHRGQQLGVVAAVLPEGKDRPDIPGHSRAMLHVELFEHGTTKLASPWTVREEKPFGLLDPTPLLLRSCVCKESMKTVLEMPKE